MFVFLYRNRLKSQSKNIALGILEYLTNRGATVFIEDDESVELEGTPLSQADPNAIEFMITLGGDGTILRAVHSYPQINAPIVGVNLGSLGFMADIPLSDIYPSLQDLVNQKYTIEERMMMCGHTFKDQSCFAVNDITFHRAGNVSLVDLAIHVDGSYLNTFSADGIIFATPCGSTAYSLAAGGPILSPSIEAFILTPISPHTISNRPIVLMPKKEIQVQYISELSPIEVNADGIDRFQIHTGEVFYIKPSERKFKLVNLPHHDYYATLRSKLGWTGRMRS